MISWRPRRRRISAQSSSKLVEPRLTHIGRGIGGEQDGAGNRREHHRDMLQDLVIVFQAFANLPLLRGSANGAGRQCRQGISNARQ
jgi:hypothetical protein